MIGKLFYSLCVFCETYLCVCTYEIVDAASVDQVESCVVDGRQRVPEDLCNPKIAMNQNSLRPIYWERALGGRKGLICSLDFGSITQSSEHIIPILPYHTPGGPHLLLTVIYKRLICNYYLIVQMVKLYAHNYILIFNNYLTFLAFILLVYFFYVFLFFVSDI